MLNAWLTLVWLSFRRLLWSTTTLMIFFPLAGGWFAAAAGRFWRRMPLDTDVQRYQAFSEFTDGYVMVVFLTFMLPICVLAYATSSLGSEREERTLVFLLTRPVPRWLIMLAKVTAALPLVLALSVGSYWILCRVTGPIGSMSWERYFPAVFYMTLAYFGLCLMFGVLFRYATIVALIYTIFVELLISEMPGVVNYISIRYYGWSLLERSRGRGDAFTSLQEPITQAGAITALLLIGVGTTLAAMVLFQNREYRDLT